MSATRLSVQTLRLLQILVIGFTLAINSICAKSASIEEIQTLARAAQDAVYSDSPKAKELAEQTLSLIGQLPDSGTPAVLELTYQATLTLSEAYVELGDYNQALTVLKRLDSVSIVQQQPRKKAQLLTRRGEVRWYKGDVIDSVELLENALQLYQEAEDQDGIAKTLNNLGIMYRHLGDYEIALRHLLKAANYKERRGDKASTASTYNNIGVLYYYLEKYQEAIVYYDKALSIYDVIGEKRNLADPLNNKGQVYEKQGRLDEALSLYRRSLAIEKSVSDRRGEGFSYANIGAILTKLNQYDNALTHLNRALEISDEISVPTIATEAYLHLANLANAESNTSQALEYLHKGLMVSENIIEKDKSSRFHELLSNHYQTLGNYEKALFHFQQHKKIADELLSYETKERLLNAELQNMLDRRDQEIKLLKQENSLKSLEIDREKTQFYIAVVSGGLFLLFFILGVLAYFHRKQLQREREINDHLSQIDHLKSHVFSKTTFELLMPVKSIQAVVEQLKNGIEEENQATVSAELKLHSEHIEMMVKNLMVFSEAAPLFDRSTLSPTYLIASTEKMLELIRFVHNVDHLQFHNQISSRLRPIRIPRETMEQLLFNVFSYYLSASNYQEWFMQANEINQQIMIRLSSQPLNEETDALPQDPVNIDRINSFELHVVQKLVKGMSGQIWVESFEKHLTICLTIPTHDLSTFEI